MDTKHHRAAHAVQEAGLVTTIRGPRRGARRTHAAAAGRRRVGALVTLAVVVAAVAALLTFTAPLATASTSVGPERAAVLTATPRSDLPGADGWYDGVQARAQRSWDDAVQLVERAVDQLERQLAVVSDGLSHLWGLLPS